MNQRTLLFGALVLALAGLVDTTYLSYAHYVQDPLVCNLLDGCNVVAQSPYSYFLGIPLAYWGLAYYLGMLKALSWMLFPNLVAAFGFNPERFARVGYRLFVGGALAGALLSIVFEYIQFAVIGAFCIYCGISALITWGLAGIAVYLWRKNNVL